MPYRYVSYIRYLIFRAFWFRSKAIIDFNSVKNIIWTNLKLLFNKCYHLFSEIFDKNQFAQSAGMKLRDDYVFHFCYKLFSCLSLSIYNTSLSSIIRLQKCDDYSDPLKLMPFYFHEEELNDGNGGERYLSIQFLRDLMPFFITIFYIIQGRFTQWFIF